MYCGSTTGKNSDDNQQKAKSQSPCNRESPRIYLDIDIANQVIAQVVTDVHLLDFAILQRTQQRQRATQDNATQHKN